MRLIDADALRKAISDEYDLRYGEILIDPRKFDDMIEETPTINLIKRGRWVMDTDPDDGDCRCSNCRLCIDALHKRNHNMLKLLGFELHTFYKFCPNCGCLMTGSEE